MNFSFGWAGPEPEDPRDVPYKVKRKTLKALPKKVDLRPNFKTEPWNQGNIGSCGPHSAAGDILYDQEQNHHPDVMPSILFMYYATRKVMGTVRQDSGVYNRDMCKALNLYGWCPENLWPYDTSKIFLRPHKEVWEDAAKRKVTKYSRVSQDLDSMRAALAQGDPFIFGVRWYQGWLNPLYGVIPLDRRKWGRNVGGHDVLIVGYSDATEAFIFRNSWGTEWGTSGYGYMPYKIAVDRREASDFWTLSWENGAVVDPDPVDPAPEPIDTGSGWMKWFLEMLSFLRKWDISFADMKRLWELVSELVEIFGDDKAAMIFLEDCCNCGDTPKERIFSLSSYSLQAVKGISADEWPRIFEIVMEILRILKVL